MTAPRAPRITAARIAAAARAAAAAGMMVEVARDGTIRIMPAPAAPTPADSYEAWRQKREAQSQGSA